MNFCKGRGKIGGGRANTVQADEANLAKDQKRSSALRKMGQTELCL